MKLKGIFGKGSGKLGNAVFAVSGGEQLVKEYNPRVSNPNTPAQVEQRAKFKLMSQLAAVFAPAIAFKKDGLTSARNKFVAANIGKVVYAENNARLAFVNIDLTGGNVSFPMPSINVGAGGNVSISLSEAPAESVKAVVYAIVDVTGGNDCSMEKVVMVSTPGAGNTFPTQVTLKNGVKFVYGYGVIESNNSESVGFGNLIGDYNDEEVILNIQKLVKSAGALFTKSSCNTDQVES